MRYAYAVRIRLLAFASAGDAIGAPEIELEVPAGTRVAELGAVVTERWPALGPLWTRLAVAVDGELARPEAVLAENSEVALLPPVSGG